MISLWANPPGLPLQSGERNTRCLGAVHLACFRCQNWDELNHAPNSLGWKPRVTIWWGDIYIVDISVQPMVSTHCVSSAAVTVIGACGDITELGLNWLSSATSRGLLIGALVLGIPTFISPFFPQIWWIHQWLSHGELHGASTQPGSTTSYRHKL